MRGGPGPEDASPSERGDKQDPIPFRLLRNRSRRWRIALHRIRASWKFSGVTEDGQSGSGAGEQLALLCVCGQPIAMKRLGGCRSCYERRRHSLRFFGGLREGVLKRDRLRCRGCGSGSALLVHHRAPKNQLESLITLCIRCHMRIHHASGARYWFPRMLLRLWRERHGREPVQLQLALEHTIKAQPHALNRLPPRGRQAQIVANAIGAEAEV